MATAFVVDYANADDEFNMPEVNRQIRECKQLNEKLRKKEADANSLNNSNAWALTDEERVELQKKADALAVSLPQLEKRMNDASNACETVRTVTAAAINAGEKEIINRENRKKYDQRRAARITFDLASWELNNARSHLDREGFERLKSFMRQWSLGPDRVLSILKYYLNGEELHHPFDNIFGSNSNDKPIGLIDPKTSALFEQLLEKLDRNEPMDQQQRFTNVQTTSGWETRNVSPDNSSIDADRPFD